MTILYVIKEIIPESAGNIPPYPPSVIASSWYSKMTEYYLANTLFGDRHRGYGLLFTNEKELNDWIVEYKLTDPDLLEDLRVWKSEHGITIQNYFFQLPDIDIDPTGLN